MCHFGRIFFFSMPYHPSVTGIFLLQDTEAYNKSFPNRSLYAFLRLQYGLPGNLLLAALGTRCSQSLFWLPSVGTKPSAGGPRGGARQHGTACPEHRAAAPATTARHDGLTRRGPRPQATRPQLSRNTHLVVEPCRTLAAKEEIREENIDAA